MFEYSKFSHSRTRTHYLVDDDLVVGAAEVAERLVLGPLRLPRRGLLLREPGDVLARLGVPQVEVVLGLGLALLHGVHLPRRQRRPQRRERHERRPRGRH